MSHSTGYALEIKLSSDHSTIHYSEHRERGGVFLTLDALGYPVNTHTEISFGADAMLNVRSEYGLAVVSATGAAAFVKPVSLTYSTLLEFV